ncbi:MAG: HNH endonuclease [Clostridia bacterium]|nr:HNH endonuclease [Clostridia bacterium]
MKCSFCEKDDSVCKIKKINGFYYCPKHLTRHYRGQSMDRQSIYDQNEYVVMPDHAEIILRDRYCKELCRAIIDIEDIDKCKQYKWHVRKSHSVMYVIASLPNNKKIHLHRLILEYDGVLPVDHINRNPLDNRKNNLRVVTHGQNAANNGKAGVSQLKNGKWIASCMRNYKNIYIGTFLSREEAISARIAFVNAL